MRRIVALRPLPILDELRLHPLPGLRSNERRHADRDPVCRGARRAALVGAIEIDPLKEDNMIWERLRQSTPNCKARLNSARGSLPPLVSRTVRTPCEAHGSAVDRILS
jgi:hypothetical protein